MAHVFVIVVTVLSVQWISSVAGKPTFKSVDYTDYYTILILLYYCTRGLITFHFNTWF